MQLSGTECESLLPYVSASMSVPVCVCVSICICVPASICNKICNELQARKRIFECNLFYFNAFIFISSHSPRIPLAYFYGALARPETHRYKHGIYGCNYKDLQGLGHEERGGGLLQLQAAGYDMFISVCVSFLMIFNYARDSYFTRAIKRSILYSAFRCRQQHQAAPDRVGEVATLAAVASGAGIGLHTKRTKA